MTQQSTAAAVTDKCALVFAPGIDERIRKDAESLYRACKKGEPAKARIVSLHGARIVDRTPTGPVLRFVLFSGGVKRDGNDIEVNGLDLAGIKSNPRVMWAHNYDVPPVGNWVNFETAYDKALKRDVLFADAAPLRTTDGTDHLQFSRMLFNMYENHDMDAVSGGWCPIEVEQLTDKNGRFTGFKFVRSDVLEGSFVPIPADPDALQRAIQTGRIPEKYVERFVSRKDGERVYTVRDMPEEEKPEETETTTETPVDAPSEAVNAGPPDEAEPPAEEAHEEPAEGVMDELIEPQTPIEAIETPQGLQVREDTFARPYSVKKDHAECPTSKPWAVVKDSDGSVVACHESEEKAKKQIAAINMNENASVTNATEPVPAIALDAMITTAVRQAMQPVLAELDALKPKPEKAEQRIGAVLSRKNKDKLEQAAKLIQAVLEEAMKEETAGIDSAELEEFKQYIEQRLDRIEPRRDRALYDSIFRRAESLNKDASSKLGRTPRRPIN